MTAFADEAIRVALRFGATMLIGAGVGGFAALVGVGGWSLVLSVLLVGCGGLFVAVTAQAWNFAVIRRWTRPLDRSAIDDQASLMSPGLFRWITLGLFGAGVGIGALTPLAWYGAMIALAAGLIGWALTSEPQGPGRRSS